MKKGLTFVSGFVVGVVALYAWGQIFNKSEVVVDTTKDAMSTQEPIEVTSAPVQQGEVEGGQAMAGKSIVLAQQVAGNSVVVSAVSMPKSGWVVVHEIKSGAVANALGAARREVGEYTDVSVQLLRSTVSGGAYAVVLYDDNGDKSFSLASDAPLSDGNGGFVMKKFNIE